MPYSSYILKSLKDGGFYFGSCEDLSIRLKKHNGRKVRSTKSRVPFILLYFEEFASRSEAYKRELFFKSKEGRDWLYQNKII